MDDSIVVIENIKRHIGLGEQKLPAILAAVREVAAAVTASTVTTVAVFLPIALVSGLTGELFRPFALTVTIALAASLFVALTIVPVLAYWFMRSPNDIRARQPLKAKLAAWGIVVLSLIVAAEIALVVIAVIRVMDGQTLTSGRPYGVVAIVIGIVILLIPIAGLFAVITYYLRVYIPVRQGTSASSATQASVADSSEDELSKPTRLQRAYLPVIRWTLRFPAIVLILAILVLGGSVVLARPASRPTSSATAARTR